MIQHMPPDILDLIKKSGKEVKKITHADANPKKEPQQGEVVNAQVGVRNVQS